MAKKRATTKTYRAGTVINADFIEDFQRWTKKIEKAIGPDEAEKWYSEAYAYAMDPALELMKAWMSKGPGYHGRTGRTLASFYDGKLVWSSGGYAEFLYGFQKKKGGLPALYLEYGTPRIEPEFMMHWAVKDNLDVIKARLMTELEKKLRTEGII